MCPWRPLCWKKSIWPDIDFWRNRTADPVFCLKNPKTLSNPIVLSLSFPLMPKKWVVRSGPTSPFCWMTQRGSVNVISASKNIQMFLELEFQIWRLNRIGVNFEFWNLDFCRNWLNLKLFLINWSSNIYPPIFGWLKCSFYMTHCCIYMVN